MGAGCTACRVEVTCWKPLGPKLPSCCRTALLLGSLWSRPCGRKGPWDDQRSFTRKGPHLKSKVNFSLCFNISNECLCDCFCVIVVPALLFHTSTDCSHSFQCCHIGTGSSLQQKSHPRYRIETFSQLACFAFKNKSKKKTSPRFVLRTQPTCCAKSGH